MKTYTKLLLFIVILAAVVLPAVIKGPNGKPIMSFTDWLPENINQDNVIDKMKSIERTATQTITSIARKPGIASIDLDSDLPENSKPLAGHQMYKWKDKHGNWQFSNIKPADTASVEVADLPEVKNVMDAPVASRKNSSTIGLPDGLSLENTGELLKKVGLTAQKEENR